MFNDAITHVVKTRRVFDAPEKSDMMLNRINDEYRYRTRNDTNFINVYNYLNGIKLSNRIDGMAS